MEGGFITVKALIALIQAHSVGFTLAAYWLFSAAVGAMPAPTDKQGAFYHWAFGFLNTLAGSISRAVTNKFPTPPAGGKP